MNETPKWSVEDSKALYGIEYWGKDYFSINANGNVNAQPLGKEGPKLDLYKLTKDLKERGIRQPILVRFPDIVNSRVHLINECFQKAITDYKYQGCYRGVYPIKVNQQRHLVEEIIKSGKEFHLGLECGSKPELLVALAKVTDPEALIICNGFKDFEYIETALLAQKLEKKTIIITDRFDELPLIISISQKLNIKPRIGFRIKLLVKGSGKWVESSGSRSKFGLTPSEVVEGLDLLKKMDLLESLEMIHFHIGSQINSIQSIKNSLSEGARFFTEIYNMGANLKYLDVGGGLGVDYDGSGSSDSSVNYSVQEYANDVVSVIQDICDTQKVPHPIIISESGRSLVAHQSLLIFNITGKDQVTRDTFHGKISDDDHLVIKNLFEMYNTLTAKNFNEQFNDLTNFKNDVNQLFRYGILNLEQLAKAENLMWALTTQMKKIAETLDDGEEFLDELNSLLSDTYFGNFSVFQSLPDSWAVGQVFPVMPLQRLDEKPNRQATLVDLTCDSDGKIKHFLNMETGIPKKTIEVHPIIPNEEYYMGVFLVGAYQEILGDLHNLFGDTDAVHIKFDQTLHDKSKDDDLHSKSYIVDHVVKGDSVGEVLGYLEYNPTSLLDQIRRMSERGIAKGSLTSADARLLMKHYEEGFNGYTYLEEGDS